MSVKRGSTAWILKSCYLIKELEICVNTVNIELWTMKNYYCWSNAKFVRWLFDLTFYANIRSQFMQSYSWGTRELLYTLVSSEVSRSESTWDIWTFGFSLCEAVKFRLGDNFFSPNFHWLFMVMRYLFWCFDDCVLNALTILFVLVLSTLLVIMLTNFSFILLIPTPDVGF